MRPKLVRSGVIFLSSVKYILSRFSISYLTVSVYRSIFHFFSAGACSRPNWAGEGSLQRFPDPLDGIMREEMKEREEKEVGWKEKESGKKVERGGEVRKGKSTLSLETIDAFACYPTNTSMYCQLLMCGMLASVYIACSIQYKKSEGLNTSDLKRNYVTCGWPTFCATLLQRKFITKDRFQFVHVHTSLQLRPFRSTKHLILKCSQKSGEKYPTPTWKVDAIQR